MTPNHFYFCKKCRIQMDLDSFAVDTFTCQNKHVFFFKCSTCSDFNATAMSNIPQDQWADFVPADKLGALKNAVQHGIEETLNHPLQKRRMGGQSLLKQSRTGSPLLQQLL